MYIPKSLGSRTGTRILLVILTGCQMLVACGHESEIRPEVFPHVEPERLGVSSESLQVITNQLDAWVASGDIVGAELLIIKKKRTILHKAFGWMNLEKRIPMERNTIFDIRSMTKPLVGTAILMLLDEGELELNDRVMKYIPSFDNEKCRDITIDHLLTHTAGFTGGQELDTDTTGLNEWVNGMARLGPYYAPGTHFYYTGRNSAVLALIIQTVTGAPAETWIEANILAPLGMNDTFCVHHERSDSVLQRISHVYARGDDRFEKYWDPSWRSESRYFAGGVGFYSTTLDYAKFLSMWSGWGVAGSRFLRRHSTVRNALRSTAFDATYARHWDIFKPPAKPDAGLPAFGHIGGYGTMAYAVPDSDLIICFFTQSRHNKVMGKFLEMADSLLY